ncbi:hypothetical protein ONS95_000079 [Cadophora gregata]|uniref:uncharacterized protein n=1 Tax=Cadophora gregata TaxID=51156 RepID=UPI0026DBE870|nr:uncharacterized protein ONS95_000079 [Cadophora gregata]KAK0115651.1 hypothetical protein ONS96_014098 [Cadophora gregata f. sp. sojae]KAK0128095.1 hypothetical protein ONS95_000079 [Cadophora gregata]
MLHYNLLAILSALLGIAAGANIFAAHYSGTVNSLTLTSTSNGAYSLALNSSLSIGGQPSWMTWDSSSRTIYLPDETGFGTASSFAVSAATNGRLTLLGKATGVPLGGVANVLYGSGYIATAHYQTSTISTLKLPLSSSSKTLQNLKYTMNGRGPVPSRQDAPHPHHVFSDPTGAFLLAPDLGADLIRIYKIDSTSGKLNDCPSYVEPGGTGPRHGVFWGKDVLYVANELANTVHAFAVTYPASGCLTLTRTQSLTSLPGNRTAPTGSKIGEIHVKDNFLYVSNRRDLSFSPNDSIATFSLSTTGVMAFLDIISSGGTYPRTFSINNAGDLMAIGDQTTANVVVVRRDPVTGRLGPQVASLRVGVTGNAENDDGLSSVLWDE